MTNTPTPRAAILDRIAEAEIVEWLKAQLAEQERKLGFRLFCLQLSANQYDNVSTRCRWSMNDYEITVSSGLHDTIEDAAAELKRCIELKPSKAQQKRDEAAALIAEAEALEAEGSE